MKVYFDESGQTGCVLPNKKGELYRKNQRFFVLAGIICNDENDEIYLKNKYIHFLEKYKLEEKELKGTEILRPENSEMLNYFIENLLDDKHIFICCYDKIFYLASMISDYLLGRETMIDNPVLYFTQQSALTRENPVIFFEFCKALELGTSKARRDFVNYLVDYPYEKFDVETNAYLMSAVAMLKVYSENEEMPEFPLPKRKGAYLNDNITHLINLNALGETLLAFKIMYDISENELEICHDHIIEFENEFYDTLKDANLRFADSKDEILLQYADNVASVFRRVYTETTELFGSGKQWDTKNRYYPKKLSEIMNKVTERKIKFVTAISDWVLPIAVAIQFDDKTPEEKYNDKAFMSLFMYIKERILENIAIADYDI